MWLMETEQTHCYVRDYLLIKGTMHLLPGQETSFFHVVVTVANEFQINPISSTIPAPKHNLYKSLLKVGYLPNG